MSNENKDDELPVELDQLLENPDLAEALESDRFRQFLDHLPVAIGVSELHPWERIVYINPEFHRLVGPSTQVSAGQCWDVLPGASVDDGKSLSSAVLGGSDFVGAFELPQNDGESRTLNAWSNLIEDDDGEGAFRLVALIEARAANSADRGEAEKEIQEKDTLLRELQHRVKNNLQMITALIRMESRRVSDEDNGVRFDRLAGRIEALALLYQSLTRDGQAQEVDLGVYLSQIASAVMQAHAVEGIRLELKVDAWPVSVNVAMPAGLVVNEVMTNALKHAFAGRDEGTIKVESIVDDAGCRVIVADDGVGLPSDVEWPEPGKLSALIVRSLKENAKARIDVDTSPERGTRVTLQFERVAAAPDETRRS